MTPLVVDAALVAAWALPEPFTEAALEVRNDLDAHLLAPSWMMVELANALWKRSVRGDIRHQEVMDTLEVVPSLVELVDPLPLLGDAVKLAAQDEHPVYDCVYAILARDAQTVVITPDKRFVENLGPTGWVRPL